MCVHACAHRKDRTSAVVKKCTCKPLNTLGRTFIFFLNYFFSYNLLLIALSPRRPSLPRVSCLSSQSCIHTQRQTRARTHTHTFRNLWPGRQSSFINFWVWVQYSVFLDSHLRAIINAGMLAEHPDLPAQICRHHCEGRAGTTPKQPTSRQPNSQTNAVEMETETKSNGKAALPPRRVHIQILCISPHLNALDIYVGILLPHSDWDQT